MSQRARARLIAPIAGAVLGLCALGATQAGARLPDNRAWELVSAGDTLGNEIVPNSMRSHAAAIESGQLPAAFAFASLGGFADVQGTGIGTEYLSQRDAKPGTSGWSLHAITAPQKPLTFFAASRGYEPFYQADMSDDLSDGIFRAWSPLTGAPNVVNVPNLYLRSDLREPGAGAYQLLTDAVAFIPPLSPLFDRRPFVAGASDDFRHVLYESRLNLTSDASGTVVKLYKADDGVPRLIGVGAACPGVAGTSPCSSAGHGATAVRYTDRTLSGDGSRVAFTAPVALNGGTLSTSGASSKLFQLDDRGTTGATDDAIVQVNASEASAPGSTTAATFETASTDGRRVFFLSGERLTDTNGGGLYMWERQPTDEQQSVTIDATGGTFTLTMHRWPSHGSGTLASGSTRVTSVSGSFNVGQTISAPDIPSGTRIVAIPSSTSLTLSAPAGASGSESLDATIDATTPPLPHDATAADVQRALEALPQVGIGNVEVTGGPGGAGGASPYQVTFIGALSGVNVAQLTADGSLLTGGAASATIATPAPISNLTLIAGPATRGVLGASEDGHHVYFGAGGQQVAGGPPLPESGIYYWQDADGTPGGTLSFIGGIKTGDLSPNINTSQWNSTPKISRVTPDGRRLLFEASDGSNVGLGYDQTACTDNPNNTGLGCSEIYVYRAETSSPLTPDLVCASCNPTGDPATANAFVNIRTGSSAMIDSTHLSRALSDDGRFVFFSTAEALVAEDTNKKSDAYVYDVAAEMPHLISSGKDPYGSYFLDASADGHDVYFVTRERLVGWDTDNGYDAYDARVDGGFPEPVVPPAECTGDVCQGKAQPNPAGAALGSAAFRGVGNARPALRRRLKHRRCRHARRRAHGRRRCVKRPNRRQARHASSIERRTK